MRGGKETEGPAFEPSLFKEGVLNQSVWTLSDNYPQNSGNRRLNTHRAAPCFSGGSCPP